MINYLINEMFSNGEGNYWSTGISNGSCFKI